MGMGLGIGIISYVLIKEDDFTCSLHLPLSLSPPPHSVRTVLLNSFRLAQ